MSCIPLLWTTFVLSILNVTHCQQDKPSFRILAPQVICKNTNDALEAPSQITISMQTEGGQKLTYRVRMYFEVLGGYRGQQHALSLWRAVRTMETKINVKDRNLIADKNQINVNNTELVQGVFYIFTITGIDENGIESEAQNFTVTYSDGKIKRTNADGSIIPDDITFLMLGSEVAYANLEYKIEANIKFCTPRYDYYFKWEVSDIPESYQHITQISGNTLRIPHGVFKADRTYTITARLVQSNDSRILLSESINVNVKKRGFSAKLIPENILIGISRPLDVRLLFTDLDNSGLQPNIDWLCSEISDGHDCDNVDEISEYQRSVEIYDKGMYTVNATVQLDTSVTVVSNITVDPDVIVVPLFKNPPLHAIPAEEHFQMLTTLDGLIPNCFAHWSVANETGYEYFDNTLIPGGLGNISISDIEGNFLSELVDFVNSTVSRDISLVVPRKGAFSNWDGLKPNAKYKFRLITTCPAPIFDSLNQSRTQTRQNVTSYVDLTVSTNQPPVGKALEVTPLVGGVGMKTIFKFSTGVALDDSDDYPLKYNFQIGFDGVKISIGEFYENMVTASQLPYSETNITTMFEVCDAREACSTVNGPLISTTMPSDKDINLDDSISNLKASMSRMEYDQSFGFALIVGTTLKNHKLFTDFKESFTKIVRNEINKLLEGPTTDHYVSTSEIVKFVNYSKTSSQIINEDDGINRGLLELLETTENENQVRSEPAETSSRRKRSVKNVDGKITKINLELDYLEKLVESKDDATSVDGMKRLVEKVKQIVTRLCNDSSFTYTNFNKSIINMEVRETNVNQIIRTNLTVPYDIEPNERRAYIQINENLKVNPRSKFCVGKIMFPSDYLSGQRHTNEIYDLIIVEKSKLELNTVDISDGVGGSDGSITLSIPIKKESGNFECQIWENGEWSSNFCTTSSIRNGYVYCRCKKISSFRATEKQNTEMATTTITTASGAVTTEQIINTTLPLLVPVNITDLNGTTMESLVTTANAVTTSIIQTMVTEPATTTLSSFSYSDNLPTTASTNLSIGNGTVANTTASDMIEVVTLAPTDTPTLITALTSTSTTLTPATITEATKLLQNTTLSSVAANNYTESVLSTIISSVDSNSSVLQKETLTLNGPTSYSSTTGYTLAVIFIIAGIFIVVGLFLYNRRKKPNSLAQQLEIISSEIRTSNNAVKYARFHDEDTMRGDNIETIFTAQ